MKLDLKEPCKNCPFSGADNPDRIVFATKERARDIAEHAYREGFPCHLSAELVEEEDDPIGGGGYYPKRDGNTQHCAGAVMMWFNESAGEAWPAIMSEYNDHGLEGDCDEINEKIMVEMYERMNWSAGHFESEQDFIDANGLTEED